MDRINAFGFQSTRPIRGATLSTMVFCCGVMISIHAPHTGRDHALVRPFQRQQNFNPRAPYGARRDFPCSGTRTQRISIHAPHTGRDQLLYLTFWQGRNFNPRAPYGARHGRRKEKKRIKIFQSTRPIRGATYGGMVSRRHVHISIHAPHTGRDSKLFQALDFCVLFQSTRPIRGATCHRWPCCTRR